MGLARQYRLTKSDNFLEIKKNARKILSGGYSFYICLNNRDISRLAVIVSEKLGNACLRHRLKRIVQEVFRLNNRSFTKNVDIIIIARNEISPTVCYSDFECCFLSAFQKANLLKV
ncbi:MAG: ribonuclease P protein component [Elusimicrobiota bacterium]